MGARQTQTLYLRLPGQEDPRLRKVRLALSFFPGENPVVRGVADADGVLGPVGVVVANAVLGEVTPPFSAPDSPGRT